MGLVADTAREYASRFRKTPSRTLARKMYAENGKLWSSELAALKSLRMVRGVAGKQYRKNVPDIDGLYNPTFKGLPVGRKEVKDWGAVEYNTPGDWLVMSDIHIPFHDDAAIAKVWQNAKKRKIVGVLLNGDIMDGHGVSHWQRDPRERDQAGELTALREFLAETRRVFGNKCEIVYKLGNHDERWELYMQQKCPELLDIEDFHLENISHAKKHGIEIVGDKRPVRLGKLFTVHGHEWGRGFTTPVNAARTLFLKCLESALCGHLHAESKHPARTLGGHQIRCWSTGCLCDMNPKYRPINQWTQGAAFVHVGNDQSYGVETFSVYDGKVYA